MLWIKAKGGLGNRMLSVASGILYANATGRKFVIDWRDGVYSNKGSNAYNRLFKAPFNQELLLDEGIKKERMKISPSIWKGNLDLSVSEMISLHFTGEHSNPLVYRKLIAPLSIVGKRNESIEVFWAYTSKLGRIRKFLPKPRNNTPELLRSVFNLYFTPCNEVEKLLHSSQFFQNNEKILGVHIRYTDLKVPLGKLLKKIRNCMTQGEYEHIFLATDNSTIQEQLKGEFPSVFTFNKRFSKNSAQLHSDKSYDLKEQDSQAALLDMYALAKCDGLVYSSRSSFSRVSRILGGFKSKDVFDIDQYNLRIKFKNFIQEYL